MARGDDPHLPSPPDFIEPAAFAPPGILRRLVWPSLPWTQLLVIGTLLCTVGALIFIFGARSVELTVTPAESTLTVARGFALHLNGHWMLLPGTHSVAAEASGYRSLHQQFRVTAEPLQHYAFALQPLPGKLRITLAPITRAAVNIDDRAAGTAPGVIEEVEAGAREVRVVAPRYLDFISTLNIEGRRREQTLNVTLQPAWAEFTLASNPLGATVLSGKASLGVTPFKGELIHGEREITVQKRGYKPWRRVLHVRAGQAVNILDVRLEKDDGYVSITSTPPGAAVTVDGKFKGETPLKFPVAAETQHDFLVLKTGFLPYRTKLSVASGLTQEVSAQLAPELAVIELVTTPADAELVLNGEAHGSATQRLTLPTFEHEIIVRKAGFATYRTLVTPRKEVEKRLQIRLKTAAEMAAEEAAPAPLPPPPPSDPQASAVAQQQADLISQHIVPPTVAAAVAFAGEGSVKSSLGQALKLIPNGDFRMGAGATRHVRLSRPYYLGVREVTNGEYRRLISNHRSRGAATADLDANTLPVTNLTWEAAATFCNWLSRRESLSPFYQLKYGRVLGIHPDAVGYRLPTEAEWEFAARIKPAGDRLDFPWEGAFPPRGRTGNYADVAARELVKSVIAGYDDGFAAAAPVGSFPPNQRGLQDLGGNVSEWTHDFFAEEAAGEFADPLGPMAGGGHVVRGSSWMQSSVNELRLTYRASGTAPRQDLGFRLARYAQ